MKRFSLSVTDRQYEYLIKLSRDLGISLGELMRRILDERREEKK